MPKIFGTSLFGILAAAIVFYIVGMIWYSPLMFSEMWMAANGIEMGEAEARIQAMGPMFFVWGLLISFVMMCGLAFILQHAGASVLKTCVKIAAVVAALLIVPMIFQGMLYEGKTLQGVGIDAGYILVGLSIAAAVLSLFRGKDAIGED